MIQISYHVFILCLEISNVEVILIQEGLGSSQLEQLEDIWPLFRMLQYLLTG